jgi:hypothetical protein
VRTGVVVLVAALAGCQDNVATPFPPGLEPFEDQGVPARPDGPFVETLRTESQNASTISVHARGFVLVDIETLWAAAMAPEPNVSECKTTSHAVMVGNEPQYDYSFLVHYVVDDILTVEWDDQWRFGRITDDLGMIKHQKVQGSDFITLSEGTIQVVTTEDPGVSELLFVEHLDAIMADTGDVVAAMQHNYDALVAVAHGNPIPPCP